MYIHWNLWLRKKVILKQFQTYPLSIVYEVFWKHESIFYRDLSLVSLTKIWETVWKNVHRRGASISNFSSWSRLIEKQFIVTREIGTFGEGNVRKITRPISTQDAAPEGVHAGRLHAFATFSSNGELAWSTKAFKIHSSRRIRNFIDPGNKRLCQPACVAYHGKENALRPSRLSRFTRLKHARNPTVHFIRVYTSTMFA